MPDLGVLEHLVEFVDRSGRDLGRLEATHPLGCRRAAKGGFDPRLQLVMMGEATVVGRELRVGRELLVAEDVAEAPVLVGVHDDDLDPAVLGAEGLRRCEVGVPVAEARRALARVEVVGDRIGEERERRGEQAHVQVLALARPQPVDEGGVHRAEGEESGSEVGHRAADLGGWAPRRAGESHDAAHPLGDRVVPRAPRVRPRLAEAGDGRVDDRRVRGAHRLVAEPESVGDARQEVLDEDVHAPGELEHEPGALGVLQVDRDPPLVPVDGGERGAHAVAAPGAQVVAAAGPLDLHDVGAEVGHERRAIRPGDDAREIEDADTVEHHPRLSHGRESPPSLR